MANVLGAKPGRGEVDTQEWWIQTGLAPRGEFPMSRVAGAEQLLKCLITGVESVRTRKEYSMNSHPNYRVLGITLGTRGRDHS